MRRGRVQVRVSPRIARARTALAVAREAVAALTPGELEAVLKGGVD